MMQNVFIMDLIEASKDKGYITMSPLIRRTLFALRDLNIRKIVPYTRREFESKELPIAAKKLVERFRDVLIKTGMVYKTMPDEEVEKMKSREKDTERAERGKLENDPKLAVERKIYHYYNRVRPEEMRQIYENTLESIDNISELDLAIALGEEKYDGELSQIYESEKIMDIKELIFERGLNAEEMNSRDRQNILKEIIEKRKAKIVDAVASRMAIEYIGGMTDNTILGILIDKGYISIKDVVEGYGRAEKGQETRDQGVIKLQEDFAANISSMIYPDGKTDEEIVL